MTNFAAQTTPKMGDLETRLAALEAAVLTLTSGIFVSVTPITAGVVFDAQASIFVTSNIVAASALDLTTATALNVTSIALPPGKWEVDGSVCYRKKVANNPTVVYTSAGALNASATLPSTEFVTTQSINSTLPAVLGCPLVPQVFDFSAASGNTTIYLVALASFSGGAMQAFGLLRGRRIP